MKYLVFLSTFDSKSAARRFAKTVVTAGDAACVNIIPQILSVYKWQKKLCQSNEVLVIGKTTPAGFRRIKAKIKKLHSYETPELIALEIADGLPSYLGWILNSES